MDLKEHGLTIFSVVVVVLIVVIVVLAAYFKIKSDKYDTLIDIQQSNSDNLEKILQPKQTANAPASIQKAVAHRIARTIITTAANDDDYEIYTSKECVVDPSKLAVSPDEGDKMQPPPKKGRRGKQPLIT